MQLSLEKWQNKVLKRFFIQSFFIFQRAVDGKNDKKN